MDGIGLSMGWVGSGLGLTCNWLHQIGWTENGPGPTEQLGQARQRGSSFERVGASRVILGLNSQAQQHFKTQNNYLKKKSKTIFLKKIPKKSSQNPN